MKRHSLEALPSEIKLELLCNLNSFGDLEALLNSSFGFCKLFDSYARSTTTRIAKNTIGNEAWQDATTILIYQREIYRALPNPVTIKKDLGKKFVLGRNDLIQLIINQQFFDSCASDFSALLNHLYPSTKTGASSEAVDILLPSVAATTFTALDTLPIKLFYRIWRSNLEFGYQSIAAFSQQGSLTIKECADSHLVSSVMILNAGYNALHCSPLARWKFNSLKNPFSARVISLWDRNVHGVLHCRFTGYTDKHLLLMKMICHLRAATSSEQFPTALREFRTDLMERKGTQFLVKKYKLDEGF